MILACRALCCAAVGAAAPKQVARPTSTEATANSVLFILSPPKASAVQRRRSRQKWICLKWMAVGTLAGGLTMQKWALRVTVGTAVASRPPYRSRRALLTHRAPPLGSGVEAVTRQRVYRSDWRKEAGDELDEPLPAEACRLAAPLERREPEPLHLVEEPPQARVVTRWGVLQPTLPRCLLRREAAHRLATTWKIASASSSTGRAGGPCGEVCAPSR